MNEFWEALGVLTTGGHLFYLLLGVLLGFVVGILPGLGGIVGFSILLPFLHGMEVGSALALLIGMVAVVPTSDTMTSVLLGIPGSASSQATVLDGFPLARRGEAARALSAAYLSSLLGGLFGAAVLTFFVLSARQASYLLGAPELFMLGIMGTAMVGMLSGRVMLKGIIAGAFGFALGTVGDAPATGEWRMTFGSYYLYDGIHLVLVGLAMFALPEIVDLLARGRAISDRALLGQGWRTGLRDTWMYRWLVLRCAGLGCVVGTLPGLGGAVVDWTAYGHAVQSAKNREEFGQGDIRGVIAPEAANNAKEGGALIPTLLFGVPASGAMAVFLGGLTLIGLEAGPAMVGTEVNYTFLIIWSLALANVAGAVLCIALSPQVARVTRVPYVVIAPFMLMIVTFASFQASRNYADLVVLAGIGLVGILMKRGGWPRPAVLIGFVLSDAMETNLYQAIQIYGWEFARRPGVLLIAGVLAVSFYSVYRYRRALAAGDDSPLAYTRLWRGDLWVALAFCGFFAAMFVNALQKSLLGGMFPAFISFFAALASAAYALRCARAPRGEGYGEVSVGGMLPQFLWFAGLAALSYCIGYVLATTVLFAAILRWRARLAWGRTLALTGMGIGALALLDYYARIDIPWGILQNYVDLPWPLG